jgi:hypothetical protein
LAAQLAPGLGVLSAPSAPSALPPGGISNDAVQEAWHGFHLVYHGDRDLLLRALVAPLAARMLAEREIDTFFFIRYDLGGPHVRLRVRPCPGRAREVAARVRSAAAAFFARHPSPTPFPAEKVRRDNRMVIPSDPFATYVDDVVFPDNSVHEAPVGLEVERYGGAAFFNHSLDAFTLSSIDVVSFLEGAGEQARGSRLSEAARALVRQSWGLAGSAGEFAQLVAYAASPAAEGLQRFIVAGDEAFERRRETLRALVRDELALLSAGDAHPPRYAAAARGLGWEIRALAPDIRARIAASHIHMTANRLGLRNPEETYLGRMMKRAVADLAHAEPRFWRGAWALRHATSPPEPGLPAQAASVLARFARADGRGQEAVPRP